MNEAVRDLLAACRAQPRSAGLQSALMNAIGGVTPAEVLDYFATLDPSGFEAGHRHKVAAFLSEGGRDAEARIWTGADAPADTGEAPVEAGTPDGAVVVQLFKQQENGAAAPYAPPAETRPTIAFADIGGLDNVKQQIRRKIIAPFEKPGLFKAFRKKAGGGVLMYGPPGCGKTMLARATAGEARAHFLPIAITDVLDKYIGESERKLAAAFAEARARKPSVLFFDELEALAARRRTESSSLGAVVSTFLNEMDGYAGASDGVLVLAATNTPWAVDSAFRRPGRFDRVLFVPPPDLAARRAILTSLLGERPLAPGLDVERYAKATSGFSGADISNLVETATELAIEDSTSEDDLTPISRRHLDEAMREVKPTTGEWLTTARNYAKHANAGGLYDDVVAFLDANAR